MPDTGAPWNIPYVTSTDLVSDWPADSLALANAIDAGLDAAGGLVAVKSAIKTDTFSSSVAAGANVAVTGLSITHEVADVSNKLIIAATFGSAASDSGFGNCDLAVHDGTGLIGVGDAAGNRSRVTAGGITVGSSSSAITQSLSATFVHTPGSGSKTYTLRAVNQDTVTRTLYVNRSTLDSDLASYARTISSLVIMEVKV